MISINPQGESTKVLEEIVGELEVKSTNTPKTDYWQKFWNKPGGIYDAVAGSIVGVMAWMEPTKIGHAALAGYVIYGAVQYRESFWLKCNGKEGKFRSFATGVFLVSMAQLIWTYLK